MWIESSTRWRSRHVFWAIGQWHARRGGGNGNNYGARKLSLGCCREKAPPKLHSIPVGHRHGRNISKDLHSLNIDILLHRGRLLSSSASVSPRGRAQHTLSTTFETLLFHIARKIRIESSGCERRVSLSSTCTSCSPE